MKNVTEKLTNSELIDKIDNLTFELSEFLNENDYKKKKTIKQLDRLINFYEYGSYDTYTATDNIEHIKMSYSGLLESVEKCGDALNQISKDVHFMHFTKKIDDKKFEEAKQYISEFYKTLKETNIFDIEKEIPLIIDSLELKF